MSSEGMVQQGHFYLRLLFFFRDCLIILRLALLWATLRLRAGSEEKRPGETALASVID
jgi:hypothetical protein